jgi:predicted permease
MVDTFWQDVRHGLRLLLNNPSFALVAVVTLALGIGANTALFSVVNTALFRPAYAENPAELVSIFNGDRNRHGTSNHAYPDYVDLRDGSTDLMSGLAAFTTRPVNLIAGQSVERINVGLVTANYFRVLGIKPLIGRDFLPEENVTPGAHPVALVSEGLWRRQLGAVAQLGNQRVWLNNKPYAVVGVVPDAVSRMVIVVKVDVFVPVMMQGAIRGGRDYLSERASADFMLVGRLRPRLTLAQAQSGIDRLVGRLGQQNPDAWIKQGRPRPVTVISERQSRGLFELRGWVVGFASVLMIGVAAVLLIACANLANVQLARGLSRRQELAVRVSLGASRARLVRQLLTETLVIALIGGLGGLLLALWTKGLFRVFEPRIGVPLVIDLSLDYRVFAFSAATTLLATLMFGLAPALQVTSPQLVSSLQEGQRTVVGSRRISRVRSLLLVGQVAVSVILLVCGGSFLRVLTKLTSIDLGFAPDRIALLSVDLSMQDYTPERGRAFVDEALTRLRDVPGVTAVDLAARVPLGFSRVRIALSPEGYVFPPEEIPSFGFNRVGPSYFQVMGIAILAGRPFTAQDRDGGPRVAIVNETAARRYWPSEPPIGKRLYEQNGRALEIIGVARTSKYESLTEDEVPFVYLPLAQSYTPALTVHARTAAAPHASLDSLRRTLIAIDADLPVFDVKTMNEQIALGVLPLRVGAGLSSLFGVLALGLACIGLYGTLAYVVSQRTAEIGIRMALGAQRRQLLGLVIRQGMRPLVWGTMLGLLPCVILGMVLALEIYPKYEVVLADIAFLAGIVVAQGSVAWLACWIPARRAVRLAPAVALRSE